MLKIDPWYECPGRYLLSMLKRLWKLGLGSLERVADAIAQLGYERIALLVPLRGIIPSISMALLCHKALVI